MPVPKVDPLANAIFLAFLSAIAWAWIWALTRFARGERLLPVEKPRVVPWKALTVLASVLTWFLLQAMVPVAYIVYLKEIRKVSIEGHFSPGEVMGFSAVSNALALMSLALILALTSRSWLRDLGAGRDGLGRQALRGLVAYPLLAPLVLGAMAAALRVWKRDPHPLELAMARDRSPGMILLLVVGGVILAPLVEELVFRGILLGWLTRRALPASVEPLAEPGFDDVSLEFAGVGASSPLPLGEGLGVRGVESIIGPRIPDPDFGPRSERDAPHPRPDGFPIESQEPRPAATGLGTRLLLANVAVSLLFAALHSPVWPTPIPLFFLSLGLGFLYQRTGSVVGPTVVHMLFNGFSTLMTFVMPAPAPPEPPVPPPAPAAVVVVAAFGPTVALDSWVIGRSTA
jgi:membrane protease YdiL (CAAX protease family)